MPAPKVPTQGIDKTKLSELFSFVREKTTLTALVESEEKEAKPKMDLLFWRLD